MTIHTTFRQLESETDCELVAKSGDSPLEIWYRAARDKTIDQFTYNDLCKACRQQLFPNAVVPIAIETLRNEPLAGEMYDGELLAAMKFVDEKYWADHRSQAMDVVSIAKLIMAQVDDHLRIELVALLDLLEHALAVNPAAVSAHKVQPLKG